jgi:predicted O-methyltransferase YrrM
VEAAEIAAVVGNTPHTPPEKGRELYDFILKHKLKRCLELGFAHGVATAWMSAALQKQGGGKVIAVDVQDALKRNPSAAQMLSRSGLSAFAELNYDESSYTWHLKRHLEEYRAQPFDFVFIDGAHNWDTDGFAFFLVASMLRPGGWILFDDLNWSYETSPSLTNTDFVRSMPHERRIDRQVRAIWETLVLQDDRFGNFTEDGNWGWAQKLEATQQARILEIRTARHSLPMRFMKKARRMMFES